MERTAISLVDLIAHYEKMLATGMTDPDICRATLSALQELKRGREMVSRLKARGGLVR